MEPLHARGVGVEAFEVLLAALEADGEALVAHGKGALAAAEGHVHSREKAHTVWRQSRAEPFGQDRGVVVEDGQPRPVARDLALDDGRARVVVCCAEDTAPVLAERQGRVGDAQGVLEGPGAAQEVGVAHAGHPRCAGAGGHDHPSAPWTRSVWP